MHETVSCAGEVSITKQFIFVFMPWTENQLTYIMPPWQVVDKLIEQSAHLFITPFNLYNK